MEKQTTYLRNFKMPALLLICLVISIGSFAQPMEKWVTELAPVKVIAQEPNRPSFSADVVPTNDSSKLLISIDNPDKKKLRIYITDPDNWEVYSKSVNMEQYKGLLDFSKAIDGSYILVVADGKKRVKKQININTYREAITHKMEVLPVE